MGKAKRLEKIEKELLNTEIANLPIEGNKIYIIESFTQALGAFALERELKLKDKNGENDACDALFSCSKRLFFLMNFFEHGLRKWANKTIKEFRLSTVIPVKDTSSSSSLIVLILLLESLFAKLNVEDAPPEVVNLLTAINLEFIHAQSIIFGMIEDAEDAEEETGNADN